MSWRHGKVCFTRRGMPASLSLLADRQPAGKGSPQVRARGCKDTVHDMRQTIRVCTGQRQILSVYIRYTFINTSRARAV